MAEEYNEEYNEEYHEEYQEDPGEPVEPEEPVEQEYDPSLDVEANETNEPSYGQGNEEQVEEGNTGNSEYDEGGVDVLETNNEDLGNTEEPLVAETTDNVDSYENESGSPDIAKGTPVDGNADFDEVPAVTEKTDGDSDDSDDDDDSKDEQLPGPTNEEQKKFLLSVLYKKVKGIKLNWKNAGDDEPWDYVEFDEEGMITSLLLPKSGIDLDFKHMAPLFSEFLQVVDLSSNKLKGFITDAFNVEIKGLISFNVSGNKKLKGDVCEDIGKSKKLTEFSVARTKLFGNISDLADCKELTIINVGNTEVSGKLKDLEEMVQLTHVCCDFSQVTGDIISASKWPELKVIYLNGKQIVGDLSVFRKHCRKVHLPPFLISLLFSHFLLFHRVGTFSYPIINRPIYFLFLSNHSVYILCVLYVLYGHPPS